MEKQMIEIAMNCGYCVFPMGQTDNGISFYSAKHIESTNYDFIFGVMILDGIIHLDNGRRTISVRQDDENFDSIVSKFFENRY